MSFNSIEEEVIYNKLIKNDNTRSAKRSEAVLVSDQGEGIVPNVDPNGGRIKANDYLNEISQRIETMETNRINYPEYMMPKQPFYRPIKQFRYMAKKIIRKSLNWALGTAFDRQTQFNNAVVPAIGRLTELQAGALNQLEKNSIHADQIDEQVSLVKTQSEEAKREAARATEQITELEKQAQEAKRETAQITEQITALEKQAEEARKEVVRTAGRFSAQEDKIQILEQWFTQNAQMIQSVNESVRIMKEQGILKQTSKITAEDEAVNLAKRTLSQSGEDVILAYILNARGIAAKDCTYLDLGANHAKQYSNTFYFYDKGARGVLVEANPSLIPELKLYRNEDVILNCCISDVSGESVDFYVLNGDGLSTPDKKRVDEAISLNPSLKIDRVVPVKTMTVNEILRKYFDKAPVFINIDLEGDDMAILGSIDWETYRPLMISIEMIPYRPRLVVGEKDDKIMEFMKEKEYIEYAFTGINSIFLDKRQIKDVLL